MNTIQLIGRLTRDPETRTTSEQRSVCKLRLAVDDGRDDDRTCFIDVATFDKQADACAQYLHKGRLVAVTGRLAYSEWEDDDGNRHSRHQVIGRVQFLPDVRRTVAQPDDDTASDAQSAEQAAATPF